MFAIRKNSWKKTNNERTIYRGYVAVEYLSDGRAVVWSGGKSYTI